MKTYTFRYDPGATLEQAGQRMLKAARSGKPSVRKDEMACADLKTLLKIARESRLEIFRTIVNQKPDSIHALAKILGKDHSYVFRECQVLEGFGLIRLEKTEGEGRPKVRPIALYDHIIFDMEMNDAGLATAQGQ
jgi:predicted transcriptional regulator